MIAVGLACFLAGLMIGLSLQQHTKAPVYSCHHKDKTPQVTKQLSPREQRDAYVKAGTWPTTRPFNLRPSFAQRRAIWERAHNTKAQMNASLAEQIRKAQEGTLT